MHISKLTNFATTLVCTFKIYCDANFIIFSIFVVREITVQLYVCKRDSTPAKKVHNVPKGSKTTSHSSRTVYVVK